MGAPNISQFYNPYQSYVLDEINRQSAMRQNVLAGQAVGEEHSVVEDKVFKLQKKEEQD
jgi:hypothetical protein